MRLHAAIHEGGARYQCPVPISDLGSGIAVKPGNKSDRGGRDSRLVDDRSL